MSDGKMRRQAEARHSWRGAGARLKYGLSIQQPCRWRVPADAIRNRVVGESLQMSPGIAVTGSAGPGITLSVDQITSSFAQKLLSRGPDAIPSPHRVGYLQQDFEMLIIAGVCLEKSPRSPVPRHAVPVTDVSTSRDVSDQRLSVRSRRTG